MHNSELVLDGGHLALDLLNTVAPADASRVDALGAPGTFIQWMEGASLGTEADTAALRASPPDARLLLADARRLREAVAAIVEAHVTGVPVPALALVEVNRVLSYRNVGVRLTGGPGHYRLSGVTTTSGPLGLIAPVAEAAARLLLEADPARLRQCAAEGCGLWFLDTSRNGRRRWCSMATCGNRAKVAAHYRRHRARG
ncbi:MAG: CGNR zinc finger domain-containing protein [Gemmatimonadetes bacterium]|nr:CGNR zinc finger domain-containing protein [Gemmatimonadota bacterium]